MTAPPPAIRFRAERPTVVVDHHARTAVGLHHWVDGTMGIARTGGRTLVMAPNGRRSSRHGAGLDALLAGLETTDQEILDPRQAMDHASGGPLLVHPDDGRLLLAYHGERFRDGDPRCFWSFIGMAVSDDGGQSFVDRGCVLTSEVPEGISAGQREVGPGALLVQGDLLHVYFVDRGDRSRLLNLGVAATSLADVWAAVDAGRTPRLLKWHQGRFAEPAIGGRGTDLLPAPTLPVVWCDVGRLGPRGPAALVYSSATRSGDETVWTIAASGSWDGIRWSTPQALHPARPGELIYVTVDGEIGDGGSFDVYRTASRAAWRWDDAVLERVRVHWELRR